MWRVAARLLLPAFLVAATRTAAAEAPPVSLDLSECPRLDAASVRRIFDADLGTHSVSEASPYVTEVSIGCEGSRVIVRVRDPLSRKNVRRSFDSTSFGDRGESRLVAIAASELVLASWAELRDNPEPKVEPEGPAPNPETLRTARAVVRARTPVEGTGGANATRRLADPTSRDLDSSADARYGERSEATAERGTPSAPRERLTLAFQPKKPKSDAPPRKFHEVPEPPVVRVLAVSSMREFWNGDGVLYGGGARVAEDRATIASWAIDAMVEAGTLQKSNVTSATVGGHLEAFVHYHWLTLRAGAGLRAGLLGVSGGPHLGTFGWPLATTCISIWAGSLVVDVTGEVGYGVLPIRGDTGPAVRGGWLSGQLAMGLAL